MDAEEIRARCERNTGWKCTLGCTTKCHKAALDRKLARARRERKNRAKALADGVAAKIEAIGAEINAKVRSESSRAVAMAVAKRMLKRTPKALAEEKHGYDGKRPQIRSVKFGLYQQHMVNTATRKVAELRRRDDSWSQGMEQAAVKIEHDWRMVHEPSVRGQAIKEFVDGAGHDVDPNIPILQAKARLAEARAAIGDMAFNLIVMVFIKGDSIDSVANLLKSQHRAVAEMTKEALNALAIHYRFERSHLSHRRLAAMEQEIATWLKPMK
jgi:hypothetical protein